MKVLTLILVLSFSGLAWAGTGKSIKWNSDASWNPGSRYGQLYNSKSLEDLSGEIVDVEEVRPMSRMRAGIHLKLKTDKETVSVHLGPAWYILNQDVKLSKGDQVAVKGSRINLSDGSAVVAAQVKKGETILQLRDKNGVPYWCAGCIPSSEKF